MKITFVTGNAAKALEVREVMARHGIEVEHIDADKPEIDSPDVAKISQHAAMTLAKQLNKTVVVEDTGLYFEAYNNFPGTNPKFVYNGIGFDGIMRLLEGKKRGAYFRTVVSICEPGKKPKSFEGTVKGQITTKIFAGGHERMPYDQIFLPEGNAKTFSQDLDYKKKVSQRVKAFEQLAGWLKGR